MLRSITLYWQHGETETELGTGYFDDVPRKDDLLSFSTDHGRTWRVLTVHRHLVTDGSDTHRDFIAGRRHQPLGVDVFVARADGPFFP